MSEEKYKFKQDDIVYFDVGTLKGKGKVCGIASNGVALLGYTYILEIISAELPDRQIPYNYSYTHMPCFESNMTIVPATKPFKKENTLDNLVKNGAIKSYKLVDVDDCGVENQESNCRNTERLYLTFSTDDVLVVDAFCSGSLQNTTFSFSNGI